MLFFEKSINKVKEIFNYLKEENKKEETKQNKLLNTIFRTVETVVVVVTSNSTAITSSDTGVVFIVVPILVGVTCGLTIYNKGLYEKISIKQSSERKHFEKTQEKISPSGKLSGKCIQDEKKWLKKHHA